jgi:hypothetical protein
MSALDTALQVVTWACAPAGPPPRGDLTALAGLLEPTPAHTALLGRLAALAAARLSLTPPPLGDTTPLDSSALLVAAAIGAGDHPAATELLACSDPPHSGWQLVVRHALVQPALDHLATPTLRERLRLASPLTALLRVPPPGEENQVVRLGERLLAQPDGGRLLVQQFCQPKVPVAWLGWRGSLLDRWRLVPAYQPFVLDVYEAARALHGADWQVLIEAALIVLRGFKPSDAQLDLVQGVAAWWQPLRALHRSHQDWLRERPYLDFDFYLSGIRLAQMVG